jgi:hypothetical protein
MGRYQDLQRNKNKTLREVRTLVRNSKQISELSILDEAPKTNKLSAEDTRIKTFVKSIIEFVDNEWAGLGDKYRTAVLETIPLLFAKKPDISTPKDIITLLSENYDWNPKGKEWFQKFLKELDTIQRKQSKDLPDFLKSGLGLTGDESIFAKEILKKSEGFGFHYFIKYICKDSILGGGSSLNDIAGEFNRFIHGEINTFYAKFERGALRSDSGEQLSKQFTSDIILIYGGGSVKDIVSGKLSKNYEVIPEEMAIKLIDGTKLIFVSLKAEGRLGKVGNIETVIDKYAQELTQQSSNTDSGKVPVGNKKVKQKTKKEQVEESSTRIRESVIPLTEDSFFSSVGNAIKNATKEFTKKGIEKIESYWEKAKDWFKGWTQTLKTIIQDFIGFAQKEQEKQDKSIKLVEEMLKDLDAATETNEAKESMGDPAKLTICFQKTLKELAEQLGASNDGDFTKIKKKMASLGKISDKYKNDKIFRFVYPQYGMKSDNKLVVTPSSVDALKKTYFDIMNSKPIAKPQTSRECTELKLSKPISKDQIKDFLWQYVNINTIPVLENFVSNVYEKALSSYKDTQEVRGIMIKFCTEMNAEAIFGNSGDLPLIKYDTGKILRLGVRSDFIEKKKQRLLQSFKSEGTPPVIAVKINQTAARNLKGEPYAFFQIKLYILSDVDVEDTSINEIPNSAFIYGVASFKNNKGSGFVFAKEVDQEIDGDALLKALSETAA